MQPADTLRFALNDRIDDAEVTPSRIPLALLARFQKDVGEFLSGSNRDIDPNQVMVSIEAGSLALVASGLLAATGLWEDVARLQDPGSLGEIDPKRAAVMERWQVAARKHPHRQYTMARQQDAALLVRVDAGSNYRDQPSAAWVPVKKYLHGVVMDLGGTSKANVHLKLDTGKVITIASSQKTLADDERNRLYKPATVWVSAEEHLHTGALRNLRLLGFEDRHAAWDEAGFEALVHKGTHAWADVPDDWVERLRSGNG